MQVQEIMTRKVELTDPNVTVSQVAKKMKAEDIGALPVGEHARLIGMVTDRDSVMRAVAENRAAGKTTVRDVMSERIYYCFEDDDVEDAAEMMVEHQVRRLPVLDRNKRLVGFIALADLGLNAGDTAKRVLEGVCERTNMSRR
jgi:CBS domain-containing protein